MHFRAVQMCSGNETDAHMTASVSVIQHRVTQMVDSGTVRGLVTSDAAGTYVVIDAVTPEELLAGRAVSRQVRVQAAPPLGWHLVRGPLLLWTSPYVNTLRDGPAVQKAFQK